MTTSNEVNLWWWEGPVRPDPRGPCPGIFYYYSYNRKRWLSLFQFLKNDI